jgi:hypothetical protein
MSHLKPKAQGYQGEGACFRSEGERQVNDTSWTYLLSVAKALPAYLSARGSGADPPAELGTGAPTILKLPRQRRLGRHVQRPRLPTEVRSTDQQHL